METIKQYASIYRKYIDTCFAEATSYRAHFILLIIMDLIFYITELAGVHIIFRNVESIGVWEERHFLFFITFMLVIDQIHMTFISEGFWNFSRDIRQGLLDFTLLKPVGAIFIVFFRYIRPASMINGLFIIPTLIYFGIKAGLTAMSWIMLPFVLLLGFSLLISLEILISTSMFWIVESMGVNFVRNQIQKLGRWPDFIFGYYMKKFFLYGIPILMVSSFPVKFLFDFSRYDLILQMIAMMLFIWVLIHFFWKLGLRKYESASS